MRVTARATSSTGLPTCLPCLRCLRRKWHGHAIATQEEKRVATEVSGPVCAAFGYEAPGSPGGFAKTTIGRIVGTPWGGNENPAGRLGCGVSWNQTNLNLEVVAAAFNQMLLFLDDMHRADRKDVEKIIEIMNGEGRGRWTETQRVSIIVPVFSTSNTTLISLARDLRMMKKLEALIDRLADIPRPHGCPYMFEGIRTPQELRAYGGQLRRLSGNFGWAGPEIVRRLGHELATDRASVQTFVDERQPSRKCRTGPESIRNRLAASSCSTSRSCRRFGSLSTDELTTTIGLLLTQFSDLANNVYRPCKHK
jgi:hypothetical protein